MSSRPGKSRLPADFFFSCSSGPDYYSRTVWELHNILVTPKMIKKATTALDSSIVSSLDLIPSVVLKDCELEHSYILAGIFNICFQEILFLRLLGGPIHVSCVGKRSLVKTY